MPHRTLFLGNYAIDLRREPSGEYRFMVSRIGKPGILVSDLRPDAEKAEAAAIEAIMQMEDGKTA